MKIQNPEIECTEAPAKFSKESKVVAIETRDIYRGIILESPEEVVESLRVYNGGQVAGSRATTKKLHEDIPQDRSGIGSLLLLAGGSIVSRGFMKELESKVLADLKKGDRFHESFDYDALGTSFFKTDLDCEKKDGKYILKINAAYVGDEPEKKLAETIKKPRVLTQSCADIRLSLVDDWWFNINLEDISRGLPFSKKDFDWMKKPNYGRTARTTFKHKNQEYIINLTPNNDSLYPESQTRQTGSRYFIEVRKNNLIGGCWPSIYSRPGGQPPSPGVPGFVLEVYSFQSRVSSKAFLEVQSVRDYLANIVKKEHRLK